MTTMKKNLLFTIIILFMNSCLFSKNERKSTLNNDFELFSKMVTVQTQPKNVEWEEEQIGNNEFGPADYNLYAIVDYSNLSEEDFNNLFNKKRFSELKPPIRDWMPQEIKDKLNDPDFIEKNVFEADNFFSSPYLNGYMIRFNSEKKIVLFLQTT